LATVYRPTDANWEGGYPYRAMASYVDAFAPMVYWECTDPGTDGALDVARLSTLRPVHVIGQPSTWPVLAAGPSPRAEQRSQNF